jgi:hypothetical protein
MNNIKQNKKQPYWIKRIYKSDHGTLLGLPKRLSDELNLNNHTYVRMYYDSENKRILMAREPEVIEEIRK